MSLNNARYIGSIMGGIVKTLTAVTILTVLCPAGHPARQAVNTLLTQALSSGLLGKAAARFSALNADQAIRNVLYGIPLGFQAPRSLRFGFRFVF